MGVCNFLLRGCCIIVLFLGPACTSNNAVPVAGDASGESIMLLEQECEAQLLLFASLLKTVEAKRPASDPTLIELKELYAMSEELYLKSDYSVALSLIDDALSLIEKSAY